MPNNMNFVNFESSSDDEPKVIKTNVNAKSNANTNVRPQMQNSLQPQTKLPQQSWFYVLYGTDNEAEEVHPSNKYFKYESNAHLKNQLQNTKNSKVTFKNIVANYKDLYFSKEKSDKCTFQVETNGNAKLDNLTGQVKLVDYTNEQMIYTSDESLYLIYGKQQCNYFADFFEYVKSFDNNIYYSVQNGFVNVSDDSLKRINKVLKYDASRRRNARELIKTAYFEKCIPCTDVLDAQHSFAQIYCCSIPVNIYGFDYELLSGIVELFLEAMYENALYVAGKTNAGGTCYLVPLGQKHGVRNEQICRAIQRACNIVSSKANLNVKLVHPTDDFDDDFDNIPQEYPLDNVNINSVWD